ncbi:zinc-dependent alcohol dehydrogenase family protein [Occallatibacter savannae]|uniref:zinc-dependent alcohol dehydrogenase family protein n=1 Tax=Occallatibacter savannae TaxID=1002691 RepID=UPI000D68DA52|nr:NAD(P)-dependent alcohol dehydrogenase [Occallatibacter savannae]
MRVWQISSFGIDSLELVERPTPQPGPGEVLVKVHAVSLNYRDLMMVKGFYNPKMKLPRVPCSDGAGEVEAVGQGVTQWKRGDRVCGIFMQNWIEGPPTPEKIKGALGGDIDGMLAEYVVLKETGLVRIPEHLGFEEAATLPCAGVTAWNALMAGDVRQGTTVLMQGTGGVSIFALQFAKLKSARVLGISSSDAKLQRACSLGLDEALDYGETSEWDKWVVEKTGGAGVDVVVEVGGVGTLPRSLRAVKMGGTIAQIGVLSGPAEQIPVPMILHKQVHIRGIYVGSRENFEEMNAAISAANLKPVYESHTWTEAQKAFEEMEGATHFGKLVLKVG